MSIKKKKPLFRLDLTATVGHGASPRAAWWGPAAAVLFGALGLWLMWWGFTQRP